MSAPDPWLTEYFQNSPVKTAAAEEEITSNDVEMIAALGLLEKQAAATGVDLSQYAPEDLVQAASDIFITKEAEAASDPALEGLSAEEQEFFNLHKFAGEVQAHSFVAEMRAIGTQEKSAAGKADVAEEALSAGTKIKALLAGGKAGTSAAERKASGWLGGKLTSEKAREAVRLRSGGARAIGDESVGMGAVDAALRKRGRIAAGVGAGTLAAGGVGGGIALSRRGKKAEGSDSATEQLIDQRMGEMLAKAGYVNDEGQILSPDAYSGATEKTAADDVLEAIDEEALRRLQEHGYR